MGATNRVSRVELFSVAGGVEGSAAMTGSPLKRQRQRRAEREREASGGRAQASDPTTRAWALERAVHAGDEVAAREAGVSRATIRSWRRRAGGSVPAPAGSAGAAAGPAPVSVSSTAAVGEDELVRTERELAEVREARAQAMQRSVALARAGNDLSAQHASRAARDFATAERALVGTVVLLRESHVRITEAEGELLVQGVERAFAGLAAEGVLPAAVRALAKRRVGEELRRVGDGERGDVEAPALREPPPVAPPAGPSLPAPTAAPAEERATDVGADVDDDQDGEPEGLAPPDDTTVSHDADEPPDDEPLTLCDPQEVPADFRNRYALGAAGAERARVTWSERLRDEQRQRAAVEAAAEEAGRERAKAAAAARAARPVGPAPVGWDGSGIGPGGGRRISHIGRERAQ